MTASLCDFKQKQPHSHDVYKFIHFDHFLLLFSSLLRIYANQFPKNQLFYKLRLCCAAYLCSNIHSEAHPDGSLSQPMDTIQVNIIELLNKHVRSQIATREWVFSHSDSCFGIELPPFNDACSSFFFDVLLISSRIFRMNQCMFVHERPNNVPIHLECPKDWCSIILKAEKTTKHEQYFDRIGMGLHLRKSTKKRNHQHFMKWWNGRQKNPEKCPTLCAKNEKRNTKKPLHRQTKNVCALFLRSFARFERCTECDVMALVCSVSPLAPLLLYGSRKKVVISVDKYLFNSSVVHLAIGAFGVVVRVCLCVRESDRVHFLRLFQWPMVPKVCTEGKKERFFFQLGFLLLLNAVANKISDAFSMCVSKKRIGQKRAIYLIRCMHLTRFVEQVDKEKFTFAHANRIAL